MEIAGRAARAWQKEGRITATMTLRLTVEVRRRFMLVVMALVGVMTAPMMLGLVTERAVVFDAGAAFAGAAVAATMLVAMRRMVAAVVSTDPNSALLPAAPRPGARAGTRRGSHEHRMSGCSVRDIRSPSRSTRQHCWQGARRTCSTSGEV